MSHDVGDGKSPRELGKTLINAASLGMEETVRRLILMGADKDYVDVNVRL
jgi:hypothetical protein